MPARRVSDAQRRDQQLLLRLTRAELEMLESASHLERQTVNAYVRDLVAEHVKVLAHNPFISADVANRRAYMAGRSTTTVLKTFRSETDTPAQNEATSP